jgi:beta-carotene 15,15'-dioxygenase
MHNTVATLFRRTRDVSTVAAFSAAAVSAVFLGWGLGGSAQWQVWLAVIALAVGIPHGAMDHIVTVPGMQPAKMFWFITGYLAVVALAVLAILTWNVIGFALVVVMSAVHFGIGDAAFVKELSRSRAQPRQRAPWWVYAIPAGALPVVVPLTSQQADDALAWVNPLLQDWHQGAGPYALWGSLTAGVVAITWLALRGQYRDALDVVALGALALLAPPLVAFAVYFGFWHAQRHTARLVLEMPEAIERSKNHSPAAGFMRAVLPGVPALLGTMVVAVALTLITGGDLGTDYLWIVLVVVWALTVPHMALTWRLDKKALGVSEATRPVIAR